MTYERSFEEVLPRLNIPNNRSAVKLFNAFVLALPYHTYFPMI